MLELWGMRSTLLLPLLPGPLWPGVIAPDKSLIYGLNRNKPFSLVHSIRFHTFLEFQAFGIVVDSWKFNILLLYILWDDWPIFMISGSNEQLQKELEYTQLKPDCNSWWISKIQSDTLEERYAIIWKKCPETYGKLQTAFRQSCMNRASVFEWHKGFSAFPKAPASLKLHYQIVSCNMQDTLLRVLPFCRETVGVFYSLSRLGHRTHVRWGFTLPHWSSRWILQPQPSGQCYYEGRSFSKYW